MFSKTQKCFPVMKPAIAGTRMRFKNTLEYLHSNYKESCLVFPYTIYRPGQFLILSYHHEFRICLLMRIWTLGCLFTYNYWSRGQNLSPHDYMCCMSVLVNRHLKVMRSDFVCSCLILYFTSLCLFTYIYYITIIYRSRGQNLSAHD